jgi:hypothetical protein
VPKDNTTPPAQEWCADTAGLDSAHRGDIRGAVGTVHVDDSAPRLPTFLASDIRCSTAHAR